MFSIRTSMRRLGTVGIGVLLTGLAGTATARAANTAASLAQVTVTSTRNYYVEIGIVVLLIAAALFAVCRSSGRS